MRSLKDLRRIFESIPRPAFLGIVALVVTGVLFALSVLLLGGARDDAQARGRQLNNDISTITNAITQAKIDREYVEKNSARYEELIKSDKLIPHTRRAALSALRDAAKPHGLEDALSFTFSAAASLDTAQRQPASGAYRLSVETIALKIEAPLDGPIYRFLDDVTNSFPGALSLESLALTRVANVNETELSQVAAGHGKLVTGDVVLSWRTAQKQEEDAAAAAKAKPAAGGSAR
jgi:hypothetical protein